MTGYTFDKVHSVEIKGELKEAWLKKTLDILKYIVKICEEHNIKYYACGGTALGAVRHHGFIPWDDDIDLMMPRKDYDNFINILSKKADSKYRIYYPKVGSEYYALYAKVIDTTTSLLETKYLRFVAGCFVDIFPIDGCSKDKLQTEKLYYKYHVYEYYWTQTHNHRPIKDYLHLLFKFQFKDFLKQFICHTFSKQVQIYCLNKMHLIEKSRDYETSKFVITWCGSYSCKREIHEKQWLDEGVTFPFEDIKIILPKDFNAYLRCMYGDYMKLPPKEERKTHHSVAYFNLSKHETLSNVLNKIIEND